MWEGIVIGIALVLGVAFLLVMVAIFLSFKYNHNELDSNSEEGVEATNLRLERYLWLEDGCPQPPVSAKYMGAGPGDTNYTYTGTLTVSNFLGDKNHIFHGLFATRYQRQTMTMVITTSGDIFAVEDSGQVRLLECMDYEGRLYKPQGK